VPTPFTPVCSALPRRCVPPPSSTENGREPWPCDSRHKPRPKRFDFGRTVAKLVGTRNVSTPGDTHSMTALTNTAPLNVRAAARARRISMTKWVLLLGSMAALGAMTTDMYLPSLPEVARELGTGMPQVQFTIAGTLIGGAAGQLFIGPMSDRFGRRTPVFVGLVVHVIASLLCAITFSVPPLFVLRRCQGVGTAAAGVEATAVIRDQMSRAVASGLPSRHLLVIGTARLLAPTVGDALAHMRGWLSIVIVLAKLGMSFLVLVWKFLPEP